MSNENHEAFDAYVRGELNPADRAAFESRLQEDQAFSQDFQLHSTAVLATERGAVHDKVAQARRRYELQSTTAHIRPLHYRYLAIAAALAIAILGTALWLMRESHSSTPEAIASLYFEAPTGLPTLLGPSEDLQFAEGMVDYKLGNYSAAIQSWIPLIENGEKGDTLSYYLGVAHLGINQPAAAIDYLQKISDPQYIIEAKWFRALAYLAQGDTKLARPLLKEVSQQAGSYRIQAAELLETL